MPRKKPPVFHQWRLTLAVLAIGQATGIIFMQTASVIAEDGYVVGGVKKGVKSSESGTKKAIDVTVGGTKKGLRVTEQGTKKGLRVTEKGTKKAIGTTYAVGKKGTDVAVDGTKKGLHVAGEGVKKGVGATKSFSKKHFSSHFQWCPRRPLSIMINRCQAREAILPFETLTVICRRRPGNDRGARARFDCQTGK